MIERKYLAHFIDAAFADSTAETPQTNYVRLGRDLEEYSEALNPQVDAKFNILGEQAVHITAYQPQSDVGTYFYENYSEPLALKLIEIANNRQLGDQLKTTVVDVLLKPGEGDDAEPTVVWAYREDAFVIPQSVGGNTQGIQVPFQVYKAGNRTKGTFDINTKKFTPAD